MHNPLKRVHHTDNETSSALRSNTSKRLSDSSISSTETEVHRMADIEWNGGLGPDEPLPTATIRDSSRDKGAEDTEQETRAGFPRSLVNNFSPSFFASTMGTGISSILLYNFPYANPFTTYAALIIFFANILLFTLGILLALLHYTPHPSRFTKMLHHPIDSLYTGCFPMGLSTIIFMICLSCRNKPWALTLAFVLWIIEAALSVLTCTLIPFLLITAPKKIRALEGVTAAYLLPVVTLIVCPATGARLSESLMYSYPHRSFSIALSCYAFLGAGLCSALLVLTVYFHRLLIHGLPPRALTASVVLPLGPLGQGAYCSMHLGRVTRYTIPLLSTDKIISLPASAGETFYTMGFIWGVLLWGFGLFWTVLAIATIIKVGRFPVGVSWWSFTFPVGVMGTATYSFAEELGSGAFKALGVAFAVIVVVMWGVVSWGMVRKGWREGWFGRRDGGGRVRGRRTMRGAAGATVVGGGEKRKEESSTETTRTEDITTAV